MLDADAGVTASSRNFPAAFPWATFAAMLTPRPPSAAHAFAPLRRIAALAMLAAASGAPVAAQPTATQSVAGTVHDSTGVPIADAEVVVGARVTVTDARGAFRVDSLRPGDHPLAVRRVGFAAVHSRITVLAAGPTRIDVPLVPEAYRAPIRMVTAERFGIFGVVADTAWKPAPGARVRLAGPRTGDVRADSAGRFAFPDVNAGQYVLHVTQPGFAARRVVVQLAQKEGRELSVLLTPAAEVSSNREAQAIFDLGMRLSVALPRRQMAGVELERFGTSGVCDAPRLKEEFGRRVATNLILNGQTLYEDFPVASLCSWRMNEIDLLEFGTDVCTDASHSLADMLHVWCASGNTRSLRRSMFPAGSLGMSGPVSYVVIWEKR